MRLMQWLVVLALWLSAAGARAEVAVPPLTARVTDLTARLDASQKAALENVLAEFEQRRGSQVFVLMLPSTAPEPIEMYALRVAEAWKAGRADIDDGVILVVAPNNPSDLRRMRLEVGRGLEGAIPDAVAKRILQDVIAPHFRQNDFYGGFAAGIAALHAAIAAEPLPGVTAGRNTGSPLEEHWPWLLLFIIVMLLASRTRRMAAPSARDSRVVLAPPNWNGGHWGHGGGHLPGGLGGGSRPGGFGGGRGGGFGGGGASGNW